MEQVCDLFEIDAVGFVERVEFGTIDVEDSSHFATCVVEGHDNLASGCRAACDVARELVNVWDNHLAHFLLSSAQNLLTSSAKPPKFSAFSPEKTSETLLNTYNSASFK